jgi:multidrug resistance efflux pump
MHFSPPVFKRLNFFQHVRIVIEWQLLSFDRFALSKADNSRRSYMGLALAGSLLGAWIVWFFLARVSVYAVTNKAELEVDRAAHPVESAVSGRVVATNLVLDQLVKAGDVLVELDSGAQRPICGFLCGGR